MRDAVTGEAQHVLTLQEAKVIIRVESDEGARHWLKTFAPGSLLPGGRIRVSRAALLAIINRGVPAGIPTPMA